MNQQLSCVGGTEEIRIPQGLPLWLAQFIREAADQNKILVENGAVHAAVARAALLTRLIGAAMTYLETEIDTEQAAALTGRHPETIRRAIRTGALPDRRQTPHGHHKVRRGDLERLARGKAPYDPIADAREIRELRRPK